MCRRVHPEPLVARVEQRRRTRAARGPDAAQHRLETQARLVLAPDLDLVRGVRRLHFGARVAELFLKAACASALAERRWRGRGTWSVKPRRRMARQAVASWTLCPVRSASQRATFGAVHSPPSGAVARRA